MPGNSFNQRKKEVLSKKDKSSIGSWDEKIVGLCDKINELENYYTTSSCSGRIVVMRDEAKKGPGLFEFVSHDVVDFDEFLETLANLEELDLDLKFKQEPCILHVDCGNLDSAKSLLAKVQLAGWKKSGIISSGKKFIVEANGTSRLEFPLMKKGIVLVDENFLKIVLKRANENLKRSWKMIEDLKKSLKNEKK